MEMTTKILISGSVLQSLLKAHPEIELTKQASMEIAAAFKRKVETGPLVLSGCQNEANMKTIKDFTVEEYAALHAHVATMLRDHVVNGERYEDVAASHQVPVGTVKSRINRARVKIANMRVKNAEADAASGRPATHQPNESEKPNYLEK
jgi:hypothetical protein